MEGVILSASGSHVTKAVTVAELLKRRIPVSHFLSLVPRPLPDFISQIFLHSCEIKSGSGLGTRLPFPLLSVLSSGVRVMSLSLWCIVVL